MKKILIHAAFMCLNLFSMRGEILGMDLGNEKNKFLVSAARKCMPRNNELSEQCWEFLDLESKSAAQKRFNESFSLFKKDPQKKVHVYNELNWGNVKEVLENEKRNTLFISIENYPLKKIIYQYLTGNQNLKTLGTICILGERDEEDFIKIVNTMSLTTLYLRYANHKVFLNLWKALEENKTITTLHVSVDPCTWNYNQNNQERHLNQAHLGAMTNALRQNNVTEIINHDVLNKEVPFPEELQKALDKVFEEKTK